MVCGGGGGQLRRRLRVVVAVVGREAREASVWEQRCQEEGPQKGWE